MSSAMSNVMCSVMSRAMRRSIRNERCRAQRVATSFTLSVALSFALSFALVACGVSRDEPSHSDSSALPAASRDSQVTPGAPVIRTPLSVDTVNARLLEIWPLAVAPGRQLDETRRIVEHLQADLTLLNGFESATLLASGDGTGLVLVAAWRNATAADKAHPALTEWLHAETDSIVRRRRLGTATTRVRVRRTAGTPPTLSDAAMLEFTRYALKPGHSFGALAALADSNLALRVLQDTSAQGGATLAAADSGALYMIVQARSATALKPGERSQRPMPFWAPFAEREEQLLAVVAIVYHR